MTDPLPLSQVNECKAITPFRLHHRLCDLRCKPLHNLHRHIKIDGCERRVQDGLGAGMYVVEVHVFDNTDHNVSSIGNLL